ncbi:TspO/MBR family protein [Enterococcus sp. HY326]|uniref:TspO/MBR family protein n=1 Tax=Enterococcus sp. HY326 TaxID=2971265 RepID=UPI00223EEEF7|nr:TspO/MBR family protein [Enterococcus sp. HY326]
MNKKRWLILLAAVVGTELVGSLSGLLAGDIRGMYESFNQIPLSPPGSLFGIVWPILYFLMGLSLFLIIITPAKRSTKMFAYGIYGLQLLLNFTWSLVFFGGDQMFLAIFNILALDLLVLCQIIYYRRISKWAAYLLVPYLVWILFATYLNIGFALVN